MSRRVSGSKSLRLKSQIMTAMGSVLFLFALVTGVYFYITLFMAGQEPSETQPASQLIRLASRANASLLNAQNSAHLYLLHQDNALKEKHQAQVNELLDQAKQLKTVATRSQNTQAATAADKIISQVPPYSKAFQDLVNAVQARGVDNSSGLREQLVTAGQKVMDLVQRNEAGDLALALLRVQHAQNEYFKTNKASSLQNLFAAIKNMDRIARESKIDPLDAQLLRKNIKTYNAALDRYQAVSLASNDPTLSSTLGKEQQRQADAMRSAADEIGTIISRVHVPDAMDLMTKTRQHETEYLLFGDASSIEQFDRNLDDLISAFNNSSILQTHKKELVATSIQYRDLFKSVAESNKTIRELADRLDQSATTLLASVNKASQIQTTEQKTGSQLPFSLEMNQLAFIAAIGCLVVILLGLVVAILLGRKISDPITSITQILRRIVKDEDFTVEIPVTSKNEIGALAVELNRLLDLQRNISDQTADTSISFSQDNMSEMADISDSLQGSLKELTGLHSRVLDKISNQSSLAEQAQSLIENISQTALHLHQIFDKPVQVKQDVPDVSAMVSGANGTTLAGNSVISQLFSQINDLINTCVDTAEQTNLLALNATVKAARAGSHGKEFSLIADEIAKLTNRLEEVAREASQLANDMTEQFEKTIPSSEKIQSEPEETESTDTIEITQTDDLSKQAVILSSSIEELKHILNQLSSITLEIQSLAQEQSVETVTAQDAAAKLYKTDDSQDLSSEDGQNDTEESDNEFINNISASLEADEEFENDADDDSREPDDNFSWETSEDVQETDSEANIDSDIPEDKESATNR